MSWVERLALAVLIAVALLLTRPARADEGIARRLVALQALVDPAVARSAARLPVRPPGSCGGSAYWQTTGYGLRTRTERAIRDASLRFGVEPSLIHSVIRHESNYDPQAVSPVGAMGMMQLMPTTARELGVVCPFEPRQNILAGTRYLRRMHDRFGSWARALGAYHAGPERVLRGGIPRVTRRYVERVLATWNATRSAGRRHS